MTGLDRRMGESTAGSLEERMRRLLAAGDSDEWDGVAFRERVADNLAHGSFRLIFAVDEITDELRRTVEFLNAHTTPGLSVLALEIGYVKDEDVEVLLPSVYGTELALQKEGATQPRWDRESFLKALRVQCGEQCVATVDAIMQWSSVGQAVRPRAAIHCGTEVCRLAGTTCRPEAGAPELRPSAGVGR